MSEKTLKEIVINCIVHHFLDQHYMDYDLIHCYSLYYLSKSQLQMPTDRLDSSCDN